jgi:hypothetical protein
MRFGRFDLFKAKQPVPRRRLERLGEFGQPVGGERYYQSALDRIAGGRTEEGHEFETMADIVLEDRNRHDSTAVRVDIGNRTVGYLSRRDARQYRAWLKNQNYPAHATIECRAMITGGWDRGRNDRGPYEVYLDLPPLDLNHVQ